MIRLNSDPWTYSLVMVFDLWILLVRSMVAFGQRGDWMKPMLAAVVLFAIPWRTLCIEPGMGS